MSIATATELGAIQLPSGRAQFRVWAPHARSVAVRLGDDHALTDTGGGIWGGEVAASLGDDYRFVLDGGDAWPDPCSRWQPEGVRGPSRILDTSAFEIAPGPGLEPSTQSTPSRTIRTGTSSPSSPTAFVPRTPKRS